MHSTGFWVLWPCPSSSRAAMRQSVDWVRSLFVLLAVFTAGGFVLVYIVMMFILPVVQTREEYVSAQYVGDDAP